ncbi:MAG: hypothetical protein Q8Q03_00320 [bacterium]|nr:hypothetical protein [bacterium]
MIKESEIVTKKYLSQELGVFRKELKTEIITEVRVMMYETMTGAMENMKLFYLEENKRHMTALIQGVKDEMRAYKDEMKNWTDKWDNHEVRLRVMEG